MTTQLLEWFRPAGPEDMNLLVVDVQERLAPAMDRGHWPRFLKGVRTLLELARVKGWNVVATEQYPKGLGRTIPEVIGPLEAVGAVPIEKVCFGALEADGVREKLRWSMMDAGVVVVGMEAHVCVLETVLQLRAARWSRVFVPWDAVASRCEEDRRTALELLRAAGAIVTSSETLAFQALGRAGTPEFKAIAPLIR